MADKERSDDRMGGGATHKKAKATRPKTSARKSPSAAKSKTKNRKTEKKSAVKSASKKSKRVSSRIKSKKSKRRKKAKAPQIPMEDQVAAVLDSLQNVADPRVLSD